METVLDSVLGSDFDTVYTRFTVFVLFSFRSSLRIAFSASAARSPR